MEVIWIAGGEVRGPCLRVCLVESVRCLVGCLVGYFMSKACPGAYFGMSRVCEVSSGYA